MHDDDLPFEGVTVLDLSQGVAGPYAGMLFARNGAGSWWAVCCAETARNRPSTRPLDKRGRHLKVLPRFAP